LIVSHLKRVIYKVHIKLTTNRNRILFVVLLLNFFFSLSSFSQIYNFRNYSVRDGLLQSTVRSIAQDKEGYVWFGTDGGLSKFDGLYFTNYSKREGLIDASVTSLYCDRNGTLWIGFASGKLMYLQNGKFKEFQLQVVDLPKRINNICQDAFGYIWISTDNAGAIKIKLNKETEKSEPTFYGLKQGLSDLVIQVLPLQDKSILIITDLGIKIYNPKKNSFEFLKEKELPVYNYSSVAQDKNGIIWLGSFDKGLITYDPLLHKVNFVSEEKNIPNEIISSIYIDKKNRVWATVWKKGIVLLDGKSFEWYTSQNGLPTDRIWSVMEDNEENIWFGLQDKGVCTFRGNMIAHFNKNNGLENEVINSITQDLNGSIWLATNEGISILSNIGKRNFSVENINLSEYFGNNLVSAITTAPNGFIYSAIFRDGLLVINPRTKEAQPIALKRNLINVIKFDKQNRLWLGGNDGLTILDKNGDLDKTHLFNSDYFSEKQITDILMASDNSVWLGTRGNEIYRIFNSKILHFGIKDSLLHPNATSLSEDENGNIWIGTEGGGMFVFDGKKIRKDTKTSKMNSDFITLVRSNRKELWIGTNQGINYFRGLENFTFGKFEGFPEMETKSNSVFCDNQGLMWFGTINGVASFDFNKFLINKIPPQVRLTYFNVFNEKFDYSKSLNLSYKQNEIVFHFKSISLTNPENVQYKYILEGSNYSQAWHTIKETNYATYTNLPAGEYTFKVMACNNNGVWNSTPTVYKFSISPPFYKTSTFYILSSLGLIIIVGGYIRLRTRKLLKDKALLEKQVKDRTQEIELKNLELLETNKIVEFKNKEITDSIVYAQHIQQAILPSAARFKEAFPQSFVLYKPKAIVSGDFYWFSDITNLKENERLPHIHFHIPNENDKNNSGSNELHKGHSADSAKIILAVADCTGHGVPGAFMCMVGNSLLNQIINLERVFEPSKILDLLHQGVQELLKQNETEARDGMDISICSIDKITGIVKYSGALRPAYIFRNNENMSYSFDVFAPDKFAIGGRQIEGRGNFTSHETKLNAGDTLFLFSDGYPDQFGGPMGKKLMTKKFKEFLHSIQNLNMEEQGKTIERFFEEWKGDVEQIDDVLVVGIRF
jgi:ligand-binding sensor domain-containing protein/serine phosphatase RsbU (regulator of sigma subunit)